MAFRPRRRPARKHKAKRSARKPAYKKRAGGARRAPRRAALSTRVKQSGAELSFSGAKHYHKADLQVRNLERMGAVNNIVNQLQYTLTAVEGTQVNYAFGMFDTDQLRQIMNYSGTSGALPKRMVVEGLTNEYTISNFTNAPVEVDIYDIVLKRDVYRSYDFTTSADTYLPAPNPQSYWNQGLNSQAGVLTTATGSSIIGTSPTDSQLFKDWFKIVKRTTIMLPQAGAHRHIVSIKTNRLVDTMLLGNPESVSALKEYTKFMMVNVKGLPVWHTTPTAETTIGSTQVGIVAVQRIKYTWVADYSFNTLLNQGLFTGSAANSVIWNKGAGAIQPLAGLASLP